MKKTKLSGSVDLLHVYIDKGRQLKGMKAIKQRKRQEKERANFLKFSHARKFLFSNRPTKRQKLSDQIQHGFNIAEKWKNE